MQESRSLAVALAVLISVAGCVSSPPVGPTFEAVEYPASVDRAHIYVYSTGVRWSSSNSWIMAVNGSPLVVLSVDSYVLITTIPGELSLSVDQVRHHNAWEFFPTDSADAVIAGIDAAEMGAINDEEKFIGLLTKQVQGGNTYFYRLVTQHKFPGYQVPVLEAVPEAEALSELDGLGLAGPP